MARTARFSGALAFSMLAACGSSQAVHSDQPAASADGGTGSPGRPGPGADGGAVAMGGGPGADAASLPGNEEAGTASSSGVTISPKSIVLQPSASQPFTCVVANAPSASCTWKVTEAGGGAITAAGAYTAPATQGTFHVVAANSANASQTDTATVVVRVPVGGGCSSLGAVGVWQSATPSAVPLPGAMPCNYGTGAFVVDPQTPSTVYLGTCQHGVWKSTDCGSAWTHINTGAKGNNLDNSRQWTFVIDPINPQILYTNAGYNMIDGNHSGAFKSIDGGVSWTEVWPPPDGSFAKLVTNNFVAQLNMDPTNHEHLLIGFHQVCAAPYTSLCYGETRDGGATWTIHNADPNWGMSESQTPYLVNDQTWLFANHDTQGGLWVTTNAGQKWSLIAPMSAGHWPGQLYHATSGWYIGSDVGIFHSTDGASWAPVPNYKGTLTTGLVGDGTTMWASNDGAYTPWITDGSNPYVTSHESDGLTWVTTPWTTPSGFSFTQGGTMGYDPVRHVLYSSNGTQGFWRVVVR